MHPETNGKIAHLSDMIFEVLAAANLKIAILWDGICPEIILIY
jgi:hypothetical protein